MEKYRKFFGLNWAEELKDFLQSPAFDQIGLKLRALKTTGLKLSPMEGDIFKAFEKCPWHKLHTIIISDHPYITTRETIKNKLNLTRPIADGLAFSAPNTNIAPRQLNMIFEAIEDQVYENKNFHVGIDNDLSSWAREGVLLLNCSLTAGQGRFDSIQYAIWEPFIVFVLKRINEKKDSLGIICMGEKANEYKKYLDNTSYGIFCCEHPQTAAYASRPWLSNNVFKRLVGYHAYMNNIKIKWG